MDLILVSSIMQFLGKSLLSPYIITPTKYHAFVSGFMEVLEEHVQIERDILPGAGYKCI